MGIWGHGIDGYYFSPALVSHLLLLLWSLGIDGRVAGYEMRGWCPRDPPQTQMMKNSYSDMIFIIARLV